jgi:hypothetical protein
VTHRQPERRGRVKFDEREAEGPAAGNDLDITDLDDLAGAVGVVALSDLQARTVGVGRDLGSRQTPRRGGQRAGFPRRDGDNEATLGA